MVGMFLGMLDLLDLLDKHLFLETFWCFGDSCFFVRFRRFRLHHPFRLFQHITCVFCFQIKELISMDRIEQMR